MTRRRFRLYVTERSPQAERLLADVSRAVVQIAGAGEAEPELVVVGERPQLVAEDGVVATPALVVDDGERVRRAIGDVGNAEVLAHLLGAGRGRP